MSGEQPFTDPSETPPGVRRTKGAGTSSKANIRSWFFTQLRAELYLVSLPRPQEHARGQSQARKSPPRLVNPNTEDNHRPPLSSTKPLRYRLGGGTWGGKIYGKNKFLLPSSCSSPSAHPRDRPRFDGPRLGGGGGESRTPSTPPHLGVHACFTPAGNPSWG